MRFFSKAFINIFFIFALLFCATKGGAFDWAPKKDFFDENKTSKKLLLKIINKEPITYCVDGELASNRPANSFSYSSFGLIDNSKNYDTTEAESIFQKWFQNVLKRAKKRPSFKEDFSDIIDILVNTKKMKKIPCGASPKDINYPFIQNNNKEQFASQRPTEDLRIVFSSKRALNDFARNYGMKEDISGFYTSLSDRKLIWIAKSDSLSETSILLHEFGHLIGFADVSYNKELQTENYGTTSKNTIMSDNCFSLSCDDADGLISMLYLALGKDKIFQSFCDKNIFFHNGQILQMPEMKNIEEFIEQQNFPYVTEF